MSGISPQKIAAVTAADLGVAPLHPIHGDRVEVAFEEKPIHPGVAAAPDVELANGIAQDAQVVEIAGGIDRAEKLQLGVVVARVGDVLKDVLFVAQGLLAP